MTDFLPSHVTYIDVQCMFHDSYVDALLPGKLHLRRNFVAKRFDDRLDTLFKEVDVMSFDTRTLIPNAVKVFATTPQRYESRAELLERLAERLKQVVYDTWNPEMAHAVLHSSGLDSRMLSWAIRELRKECGDGWFGDTVFLCSRWETEEFRKIMKYQDFEYYVPLVGVLDEHYYYEELLDFAGAWERHDGPSAIPVNLFWREVWMAQKYWTVPTENVQLYTGQWGNTVLDAGSGIDAGAGIKKALEKFYYSVLFRRPMKGDVVIHPFLDCELATIVASSRIRLGKQLRPLLLEYMDPELAKFTNMNADGDRHRRIADSIISKMIDDYDNSWYGREVAPGARPEWKTTEFQPFWSRWTTASLCEHLLQEGYEIKVCDE